MNNRNIDKDIYNKSYDNKGKDKTINKKTDTDKKKSGKVALTIRVTPEEKELIDSLVAKSGRSFNRWAVDRLKSPSTSILNFTDARKLVLITHALDMLQDENEKAALKEEVSKLW